MAGTPTERREGDGSEVSGELTELPRRVLASVGDAVLVTESAPLVEPGPRVVYVNAAFTRMTGYSARDIVGRSPRILQGEQTDRAALSELHRQLTVADGPIRVELMNYRRDGSPFWVELLISVVRDDQGTVTHFVSVQRETTDRKRAELELTERLDQDGVTGLLNRRGFLRELVSSLAVRTPDQPPPAVVLFDVRGVRQINHRYGRDVGDSVLREVARRLEAVAVDKAVVAQLAGGEFALLICDATQAHVIATCERASRALLSPVHLPHTELALEVSGGVATDGQGSTALSLLREADVARRVALATGPGRYEFYEPAMGRTLDRRLDLDQGLRSAVRNGELSLQHQLIVDLRTGVPSHAEALLRWNWKGHGRVNPAEFIPVAEETGAILSIGEWVLNQACRHAAGWQALLPGMGVTINLSPRQLADPDLLDDVLRALDQGLDPNLLMLEITEGALVNAPETASTALRLLRERGIGIALDDFGTGYSSLSYLKRLPVDLVKIDKSFVDGVEDDTGDRAVIQAVLTLTSALGLQVVAEGVETQQQRAALIELGCRSARVTCSPGHKPREAYPKRSNRQPS